MIGVELQNRWLIFLYPIVQVKVGIVSSLLLPLFVTFEDYLNQIALH